MDDRAVVAALVAGDPRGLDVAYRRYAPRLYAYSRGLLRDGEAAADVVQDTFVLAGQRAGQLRDPDRLLAWLYAIARHECLRQQRARRRESPTEIDEPAADTVDPAEGVRVTQVRELVHAAAEGLGDRDREVVALALRHELAAADVAAVLGVSVDHAHARLSRARAALERALGVLLVARAATCPTVRDLVVGWNGRLDPLLRKRLGRHVDGCARCRASRGALLSPAALLGAYTAGPFAVSVPAAARPIVPPDLRLGPRTGFPVPRRTGRRGAVATGTAAAAAAAVLALLHPAVAPADPEPVAGRPAPTAPATVARTGSPTGSPTGPPPVPPTVPVMPGPSGPGLAVPTGGADRPRTVTHPRTRTPTPAPAADEEEPSGDTATPAPSAFVVGVTGGVACAADGFSYRLSVSVQANRTMTSSRLYWHSAQSGTESTALTPLTRASARGGKALLRHPEIEWWVRGTGPDGTADSPHRTSANPCD